MSRMTRSLGESGARDPEAGAFIGFHTEPDSSDNDDALDPPVLMQGNTDFKTVRVRFIIV